MERSLERFLEFLLLIIFRVRISIKSFKHSGKIKLLSSDFYIPLAATKRC